MKRKILLCMLTLLLALLPGCGTSNSGEKSTPESSEQTLVTLKYYTIGSPDDDLVLVNDALNTLLAEKIGVRLEYNKIPWAEYNAYITNLISSGSDFDICFASSATQGDFAGNARRGVWLALDDYLGDVAHAMYETIDPLFWEGARVNGAIYGVPTNKELAVPVNWVYCAELVERYGVDVSAYKTLESLEPLMEMIQANEPDYLPMELSSDAFNYFSLDGYEYLYDSTIPLMLLSEDEDAQLVNIYETESAQQSLSTIRRYYERGFINTDAALRKNQSLTEGKKVFWFAASGGPFSESSWTNSRGYPLVAEQVTASIVNTESIRGGVMVVNARSAHPLESVQFLNLLNTDPEVRNTINYGIEGTHYTLTENDQVESISSRYAGVQYTQGNWFILKTVVGDPLDKWEQYRAFNAQAVKSTTFGFTPDFSDAELAAINERVRAVSQKYCAPVMTGTVDPDVVLPQFLEELNAAGIDTLRETLQAQLDAWKAENR